MIWTMGLQDKKIQEVKEQVRNSALFIYIVEMLSVCNYCAPGGTRTPNLGVRSALLCPFELLGLLLDYSTLSKEKLTAGLSGGLGRDYHQLPFPGRPT